MYSKKSFILFIAIPSNPSTKFQNMQITGQTTGGRLCH
jgi:hypothetical protein